MTQKRFSDSRYGSFMVAAAFFVAGAATAHAQEVAKAPEKQVEQMWAAGNDRLLAGDFQKARTIIDQIVAKTPENESYAEVASWLDHWESLDVRRLDFEKQLRDRYLYRTRKNIEKQKYDAALTYLRRAVESAPQDQDFMKEDWVKDLHDKAVAAAKEHEEKHEWADASGVYYTLNELYEGNSEYKSEMDRCLARSRLEVLYDDEADWQRRLSGVDSRMVEVALRRVSNGYVMEPDLKSVCLAGYQRLLLLPEAKSLNEGFESLKDTGKREEFIARIRSRLKRINRMDTVSEDKAAMFFKRALAINAETIALPDEIVIYEYVDAGLEKLDQFTSMIWPEDYAEFEKHTQGHFPGVGIQIQIKNTILTVVSPLEDSPAFRADIQAEDQIMKIDGESAEGLSLTEAVRKITGPVGTNVVLSIHRPSTKKTTDYTLTREEIQIKTVRGYERVPHSDQWNYFADPDYKIAYVRLTNFAQDTAAELRQALNEIEAQGGQALILDLRFNPGGLLRSAIDISELFLDPGKTIVSTSGLNAEEVEARSSSRSGPTFHKPVIVLVNKSSASASEIVSGALKDHARALIVGERTFGKGSVQNLIPVGRRGGAAHLKLTTAHYYLPNGSLIHKVEGADEWGVEPDISVVMTPSEAGRAFRMRRDADVIRQATATDAAKEGQPADSVEEGAKTPVVDGDAVTEPAAAGESEDGDKAAADGVADEGGAADDDEEEDEEEDLPVIELPEVDYQMEKALLVLRAQLIQDHGFTIMPRVKLGQTDKQATIGQAVN